MIIHTAAGSTALEGGFSNGLASGPMRVTSPGQKDQFRNYTAGQDTGSTSATPPSAFQIASYIPSATN